MTRTARKWPPFPFSRWEGSKLRASQIESDLMILENSAVQFGPVHFGAPAITIGILAEHLAREEIGGHKNRRS